MLKDEDHRLLKTFRGSYFETETTGKILFHYEGGINNNSFYGKTYIVTALQQTQLKAYLKKRRLLGLACLIVVCLGMKFTAPMESGAYLTLAIMLVSMSSYFIGAHFLTFAPINKMLKDLTAK